MTPSARKSMAGIARAPRQQWLALALLIVAGAILVACQPIGLNPSTIAESPAASASPATSASEGASPAASAAPTSTPTPAPNPNSVPLQPATRFTDPFSTLAWLFTPVFQALLILLLFFEQLTGNMAFAIVIVTLLVRVAVIPLYRRQIVSQKRMQLLQPELKEIQRRFKGDRTKIQQAQAEFYKERGVNPASGCLPLVLQFMLLIPMYSVFSSGLQNVDPSGMLHVFGIQVVPLQCGPVPPPHPSPPPVIPCINSTVLGVDLSQPNVLFSLPFLGLGISVLALISAGLNVVQSRMALPPASQASDDPGSRAQRQTMLFIPLISIFYGGLLPAGLFIYWIVATIFSIVQQYLITGWGGMFPIFGWHPPWAADHTPRFPVAVPAPDPAKRASNSILSETDERTARAATTVRTRERSGRQGRRGRRR